VTHEYYNVIIHLYFFFNDICAKIIDKKSLDF